jgi:DNA (cytosine-5)-methyltransferase 1
MKIKKPQCVILENVKNILSHDNGNTIKNIVGSIQDSGYDLSYKILNTSRITGIPQNRERVYFICIRNDLNLSKSTIDSILHFKDVEKKNIKDFLEPKVNDNFYYKTSDKIYKILQENVVEKNEVYQYRRTYVRKNMSSECPTLTAVMGTGGHNVPIIIDNIGIRKLTPKECFNLQGFPENYKLPDIANCHLYKLAGNSVTFPIVEELSKRILKLLV